MKDSAGRAAQLRDEFDRAFAAPPPPPAPHSRDFVIMHLGGQGYAVALEEIAGIVPAGRIVPLPGAAASLLGAMGLKGGIVFVRDTALLLGLSASPPRWLLLTTQGAAFAFEGLGAWLRAAVADIASIGESGPLQQAIRGEGRLVLSLDRLADRIRPGSGAS